MEVFAINRCVKIAANLVMVNTAIHVAPVPHLVQSILNVGMDVSWWLQSRMDNIENLVIWIYWMTVKSKPSKPISSQSGLEEMISSVSLDNLMVPFYQLYQRGTVWYMYNVSQRRLAVKLVFSCEAIFKRVHLEHLQYPVKPYIVPVIQCFKYRRLVHSVSSCCSKQICARCGSHCTVRLTDRSSSVRTVVTITVYGIRMQKL